MRLYFFFLFVFSWEAFQIHLQCAALRTRQGVISAVSHEQNREFDEKNEREDDNKSSEKEKEEAERETEEMDYSLATKNLENEIEHREQIKSQDRKAEHSAEAAVEKIEAKAPACSVQKTGKLMVAKDPLDILSVDSFAATITKRHFTVHYPGHPEAPFIKIPIIEIQTPMETLKRSRRCFRLYHKESPKMFCAETNGERNEWMKDIYKAIFCINSGVQAPQGQEEAEAATEQGSQVTVPDKSTKVERWTQQQIKARERIAQEAEKGEISADTQESRGVPEIEISASQYGQPPKVSVNGEDIAVPNIAQTEQNMNEGAMEG